MNNQHESPISRLMVDQTNDLPKAELQALGDAFAKQGTVMSLVIITTPQGHAILTTNNIEESLVRNSDVGRHLVRTLREYADNLQAQLDLGMNEPSEGDVAGLGALMSGQIRKRGCDA